MEYITVKRFKRRGIGGDFNIPYGTRLTERGGTLFFRGMPVCRDASAVMREHFARDDDGSGLLRGKLTREIARTLGARESRDDPEYQARWDRVWNDPTCLKYKKAAQADYFLWDISFYNAPVEDLLYIAALVAEKGE